MCTYCIWYQQYIVICDLIYQQFWNTNHIDGHPTLTGTESLVPPCHQHLRRAQEYGRLLPILLDMERESPGELCVRQFLADPWRKRLSLWRAYVKRSTIAFCIGKKRKQDAEISYNIYRLVGNHGKKRTNGKMWGVQQWTSALILCEKSHEDPESEIYRPQLKDSSWMFFGRVVT